MRVIFMGTPDFSVPALEALLEAGHDIVAVYCQPPRPAGRGGKERQTPVHARALELGLEVRHPPSLKDAAAQAAFAVLKPDVAVVVAYGQILPQPILEAPGHGCLNIHASLLPRWRGAAPIQRAVMAGDAETGVCVMRMETGLDTGPVFLRRITPIGPEDTAGTLHDRLSMLGAQAIVDVLDDLPGRVPEPQSENGITYAAKIDKTEARIDWSAPAAQVDRRIRGLSPFPGAWTEAEGVRIKLLASCLADGEGAPGEVLDDRLTVACGTGAVRVLRLQRSGRGMQEADAFLRGTSLAPGTRLGAGKED